MAVTTRSGIVEAGNPQEEAVEQGPKQQLRALTRVKSPVNNDEGSPEPEASTSQTASTAQRTSGFRHHICQDASEGQIRWI